MHWTDRWRTAAIAWLVAIAGVGIGIATYGGPDDGTHHDYCARNIAVPPASTYLSLTDQELEPVLYLRVGEAFVVRVDSGASPVATPLVTRRGVVCQASRSASAVHLAVTFVAVRAGTTHLLSFYDQTGGAGGTSAAIFTATVVVSNT